MINIKIHCCLKRIYLKKLILYRLHKNFDKFPVFLKLCPAVESMDLFVSGIQYITNKFPIITEAKRKSEIFVVLQIRRLTIRSLNKCEAAAWGSFKMW